MVGRAHGCLKDQVKLRSIGARRDHIAWFSRAAGFQLGSNRRKIVEHDPAVRRKAVTSATKFFTDPIFQLDDTSEKQAA